MSHASSHSQLPHIVMVDDESSMCDEVEDALDGGGLFEFIRCPSFETLAQLMIVQVDLFILDMYFPEGPGLISRIWDLLEIVRSRWPQPKIIVLTNFPFLTVPAGRHVIQTIPKPTFLLHKSVLRGAVIRAIREANQIDPEVIHEAIEHLKTRDFNDEAQETTELSSGDIVYPLRGPTKIVCDAGYYSLSGIEQYIKGRGETASSARKHFVCSLHETYHRLLQTRPVFQNPDDKLLWETLARVIDVEEYDRLRCLIVPHELGQIADITSDGVRVVQWHGGDQTCVSLDGVPDEMATMKKGQWFKATIRRRYASNELLKVLHICPIDPPVYTEDQRINFWNQVDRGRQDEQRPD